MEVLFENKYFKVEVDDVNIPEEEYKGKGYKVINKKTGVVEEETRQEARAVAACTIYALAMVSNKQQHDKYARKDFDTSSDHEWPSEDMDDEDAPVQKELNLH